jgi:hypothetical protein
MVSGEYFLSSDKFWGTKEWGELTLDEFPPSKLSSQRLAGLALGLENSAYWKCYLFAYWWRFSGPFNDSGAPNSSYDCRISA